MTPTWPQLGFIRSFSDDEPDKPALNLKEHLKGLINKVDGLNGGEADGGDEPKFEAISSDEDDDDQPDHFGLSLGKNSPLF